MKNFFLICILLFTTFNNYLFAQLTTCSVNAGVTTYWCFGQNIQLQGNLAGEIVAGSALWTQTAGAPVNINNPTSLSPTITAPAAGTYTFKLSAKCSQGIAEQIVTHIVNPGVIANAGPDITINCYDLKPISLKAATPPPSGFVLEWKVDLKTGVVEKDSILRPSSGLFNGLCSKGIKDTFLIVQAIYRNPKTGCTYTDNKTIWFRDFATPLKILFTVCPEELDDIKAVVGCASPSQKNGTWTFIAPAGGGGASFTNPNEPITYFKNLKAGSKYVIQWSINTDCGGLITVRDTLKTTLGKRVAPFFPSEKKITFCTAPDSFLLVPPHGPDISKGETGKWILVDAEAYSNLPKEALDAYGNIRPIAPYTFDSVSVPVKGFRKGFAYQFDYVIDNGSCPASFTQWVIVLGNNPSKIEVIENQCGQEFYSQCGKVGKYCFIKPFTTLFIQGGYEKFEYVGRPRMLAAPSGIEKIEDLGFEDNFSSFSINRTIPVGNYIFEIKSGNLNANDCLEPYYYQINLSSLPIKANAGTDVYTCSGNAELPGNAVKTPNWYLLDKVPANAATPILTGDSTFNLKLKGLSPNAEYRYIYRSYGGTNCESAYDTVTVRSSNQPPIKPNAGADITTACAGSKIVLNATPAVLPVGVLGTWILVSQVPAGKTPKIENPNGTTTNISNVSPNTTYTFRFLTQNGCGSDSDEVMVTTDANDGPNPPNAGKDYCLPLGNSKVVLIASAPSPTGATGQWTALSTNPNPTIFDTPNKNSTLADGLKDGQTYYFVYTVTKGTCGTLSDTVKITVASPPKAKITTSVLDFCNSQLPATIKLDAEANLGKWTQTGGIPGAIFSNADANTTTISNLLSGVYKFRYTIKNDACSGSFDEVTVKIGGATPIINLGKDTTLCTTSKGILKLNAPTAAGFTGFWVFPDITTNQASAGGTFVQNTNASDPKAILQLNPGKTRIRWYLIPPPPCNDQPSFDDIVVDYIVQASVPNDTLKVCNGTIIELKANNVITGEWSQVSGTNVQNLPKTQVGDHPVFLKLNGEGTYKFRFTVASTVCGNSQKDVFVINHIGVAPNIGAEDTLCVKDAIFLNANILPKGYTATWTVEKAPKNAPAPSFSPNKNAQQVRITNLRNGRYEFLYTISDGICTFSDIVGDSIRLNLIDAGPDKVICRDTSIQLAASANLKWLASSQNPSPTLSNSLTGKITGLTKNGDYYFFLTDPEGCSDDVKVSKLPSNIITAIPKDITICVGDKATLEATIDAPNKPFTLQWQSSKDNGATWNSIANATKNPFVTNSFLTNNTFEKYRIIVRDPICGSDTSKAIKVSAISIFDVNLNVEACNLNDGKDNNIVDFSKLILKGDPNPTWKSLDHAEPLGTGTKKDFTGWQPNKTYRFLATTTNAQAPCINVTDTLLLFIKACCPKVTAVASVNQKITCKVRQVEIKATISPNTTFVWTDSKGKELIPTQLTHQISVVGTYHLEVKDTASGCGYRDSVQVIQNEPFITDLVGAAIQPPCAEGALGSYNLTEVKGGTPPFQYSLNGKKIPNANPIKDLSPGKYTLLVEDKNGCTAERIYNIERVDDWSVKLYRDTLLDWGEGMELEAVVSILGNKIKNIQWFGDGKLIDSSKLLTKNITPSKTTTYEILVFDIKGCSRRAKVLIQVKFDPKIYAPNSFSPNDDGINDRFRLFSNRYIKAVNRLDIFDRWGEWIYTQGIMSLDDPLFGWDGTFRNQAMNNAVFVWVAEVEYLNGEKAILKGDVMLLR